MSTLIEIEKLIKMAKKEGVDLGKGDPYNRLRYYTKIGWLPHMIRQKNKSGEVVGHYPNWVIDRLVEIERLKEQGLNNDEITSKIDTRTKLQNIYAKVNTPGFKNRLVSYITIGILVIILLNELDVINLSKSKNREILDQTAFIPAQILDSGVSFVPANNNRIFVKNSNVNVNSKVYVTFNNNFSPATRYWVSGVEPQKGFYVELDTPVFDNVEFSWWISN